jgi:DNA-binding NtrC family response regulator
MTHAATSFLSVSWEPARRPAAAASILAVPRIVLFDDDPLFGKAMERAARLSQVSLASIADAKDVEKIANMQFDVAIVDFDLGDITGVEVAEFLCDVATRLPMLMISHTDRCSTVDLPWPRAVKGFVNKHYGPDTILEEALDVYDQNRRSWSARRRS